MTPELQALIIPGIVAVIGGFIGAIGTALVRYLEPDTRRAIRKDALQEWRDIAAALEGRVGALEERAKTAEAAATSATIAADIAKKEATQAKAEAEQERLYAAARRAEQDATIAALTRKVEELTTQLNERSSMAVKRELELEKQVGILQSYVKELTGIMEANGLEVPPLPQDIKPARRRRRTKANAS